MSVQQCNRTTKAGISLFIVEMTTLEVFRNMLIKDIAEKTGIGRTTVKFYIDKFPEFMFYRVEGRRKSYSSEMVDIIKFISNKYAEGWNAEQIREVLAQKYDRIIDTDPIHSVEEKLPAINNSQSQELINFLTVQITYLYAQNIAIIQKQNDLEKQMAEDKTEIKEHIERIKDYYEQKYNTVTEVVEQNQSRIKNLEERVKSTDEALIAWQEVSSERAKESKQPWWKKLFGG